MLGEAFPEPVLCVWKRHFAYHELTGHARSALKAPEGQAGPAGGDSGGRLPWAGPSPPRRSPGPEGPGSPGPPVGELGKGLGSPFLLLREAGLCSLGLGAWGRLRAGSSHHQGRQSQAHCSQRDRLTSVCVPPGVWTFSGVPTRRWARAPGTCVRCYGRLLLGSARTSLSGPSTACAGRSQSAGRHSKPTWAQRPRGAPGRAPQPPQPLEGAQSRCAPSQACESPSQDPWQRGRVPQNPTAPPTPRVAQPPCEGARVACGVP